MRLFIAIELPAAVSEALGLRIDRLRPLLAGLRWVRAEAIHLTLRFLGDTDPRSVAPMTQALQERIPGRFSPLSLRVSGAGLFPQRGRPRVVWAGLSAEGPLAALQSAIETLCVAQGFPAEPKPFRPHLTLARCGDGPPPEGLRTAVAGLSDLLLESFPVESITLFESRLAPSGARYLSLARVAL